MLHPKLPTAITAFGDAQVRVHFPAQWRSPASVAARFFVQSYEFVAQAVDPAGDIAGSVGRKPRGPTLREYGC
jgi:hypothetical protein